jgi:nitrile hydratase accessory protein
LSVPETVALPGLPRDAEGPVFAEPWQAQAFALAVRLNAAGAFTWAEWADVLGAELARDPGDDGARYYHHWVAALERLVASRGLAAASELDQRKADWAQAYRRTPHGAPVEFAVNLAD